MPTAYGAELGGRGFRLSVRGRKDSPTHSPDLATGQANDVGGHSAWMTAASTRVNGVSSRLAESNSALAGPEGRMAAAANALPAVIAAVFAQQIAMFAQANGRDLCENAPRMVK